MTTTCLCLGICKILLVILLVVFIRQKVALRNVLETVASHLKLVTSIVCIIIVSLHILTCKKMKLSIIW